MHANLMKKNFLHQDSVYIIESISNNISNFVLLSIKFTLESNSFGMILARNNLYRDLDFLFRQHADFSQDLLSMEVICHTNTLKN